MSKKYDFMFGYEYDPSVPKNRIKCKITCKGGEIKIYDIPHDIKEGELISLISGKELSTYE